MQSFEKIEHLINDSQIKALSVMKNILWISKDNEKFEETQIQFTDEEVFNLIKLISKGFVKEPSEINPTWRGRSPNGFISDIVMKPVSFDKPVVTMYREELFNGDFYNY